MEQLRRLSATPDAAYYEIEGEHQGEVERYVVSTPQSRDICNRPELLGLDFNLRMRDAMTAALAAAPFRDLIADHPEEQVCVVNFLRGGLNFELRRALGVAYGLNRHSSAFMSSQRAKVDGRWMVREDMYRKLRIPDEAVLVIGDVVATGVTLANGFDVIADHVAAIGSSLRGLVLFTIGCHKAEKVLEPLHAKLRERFPGYERTVLVYLEAKFRLVDSRTRLRIGIPGTDLVRHGTAVLTPEFERSQYDALSYPLERCGIYDAGSRAFDIAGYVKDVVEYWAEVRRMAVGGWTLAEALAERWPAAEYADWATFAAAKTAAWQGVDDAFLRELYACHEARWDDSFAEGAGTSTALAALCDERIAGLTRAEGKTPA